MKKPFLLSLLITFCFPSFAQVSTTYTVSFDKPVHHEAVISATFKY